MKKMFAIVSVLALSACWSGGRLDLWEGRNAWIESFQTYDIEFFDQGSKLISTEFKTIKNYKANKVMTVYKGYSIANVKTYRKDIYASSAARANMDGGLASSTAPIRFKKNDQRDVIGTSIIDGQEFYLIDSGMKEFVFLTYDDGSFYKKMGQIRNNRLAVLDTDYFAGPEGFKLEPVTNSSMEQGEPTKGYDVKFDGATDKKISFIYFDYSAFGTEGGNFENLTYPNKEGEISIKGIRVKVIHADAQKLDYMIIE